MTSYSQTSKRVAWALLVATLFLAFLVCFAVGFVSVFVGFIKHLIEPEYPWRFAGALWFASAVLLPALLLARFYFVVAANRLHSPRYATIGWAASACYHAALTWLFIFYMPGTLQTSGSGLRLPLSFISGAALCASLYLLIRYPRPPQLPTQ
jgi:uncharacterized BrkB/YihY/UPF0761 family membrane protein